MKKKMYVLVLLGFVLFFLGCSSFKQIHNKDKLIYFNEFLVVVNVFSKSGEQMIMMNGVGKNNDLSKLSKVNRDEFFISFYNNYAYSPLILNLESNYKDFVNCFGYDISWYNKYLLNDITDKPESIDEIELEDGFYVKLEYYKLLNDIKVEYVNYNIENCLYDVSIEISYKQKKVIVNRIALFLDK